MRVEFYIGCNGRRPRLASIEDASEKTWMEPYCFQILLYHMKNRTKKTSFLAFISTNNHKCFLYNKIAGLAKNFLLKLSVDSFSEKGYTNYSD